MDLYSIAALSASKEATLSYDVTVAALAPSSSPSKEATLSCDATTVALAPWCSASRLMTLSYNIMALAIALFFFFDEAEIFAKAFSSIDLVSASSPSSSWTRTARRSLSAFDVERL